MFYIQLSHKTLRNCIGTATTTPWSMASTYRLNCVRAIGWISDLNGESYQVFISQAPALVLKAAVNGFTSELRKFWKESRGNLNTRGAKGTGKPLYYFVPGMWPWTTIIEGCGYQSSVNCPNCINHGDESSTDFCKETEVSLGNNIIIEALGEILFVPMMNELCIVSMS